MPAYDLTITTTKKIEKEWLDLLAHELHYLTIEEMASEDDVDYGELESLSIAKGARKVLVSQLKDVMPKLIESAVKALADNLNKNSEFEEFFTENFVWDSEGLGENLTAPLLKNEKAMILADKKYQKLVANVKHEFTERKREELLSRAKALGATVTFPDA